MKTLGIGLMALIIAAGVVAADNYEPGLVAHYFADPVNWDGIWPDSKSLPGDSPMNWTFTQYKYSRVEPVVNHLFIKKGWFTVRWKGVLNITGQEDDDTEGGILAGEINVNPGMKTGNGDELAVDDKVIDAESLRTMSGTAEGVAQSVVVTPKGNGNRNGLTIDGYPFPLQNGTKYTITGKEISYKFINEGARQTAVGKWWLTLSGSNIVVACGKTDEAGGEASSASGSKNTQQTERNAKKGYVFEMLADDGCRLFIDGQPVIDDWTACWEQDPQALRRSKEIFLKPGAHDIVVEYFEGQSLADGDSDPACLFWSTTDGALARQIVRPEYLMHSKADLQSSLRKK